MNNGRESQQSRVYRVGDKGDLDLVTEIEADVPEAKKTVNFARK